MITIYSIPRDPVGIFDELQSLAVRSWLALEPKPQVILIGNKLVEQWAKKFEVLYVPSVCDDFGTPYILPAIQDAEALAHHKLCGWFNTDNILLNDFYPGIKKVAEKFDRFVAVGQRTNLDINFEIRRFDGRLKEYARKYGELFTSYGIDFFVYQGVSLTDGFPEDFLVGRNSYDNWLVRRYVYSDIPLVDLTPEVMVIHANHPPQQKATEQMVANRKILGEDHAYGTHHADFRLTAQGVQRRH